MTTTMIAAMMTNEIELPPKQLVDWKIAKCRGMGSNSFFDQSPTEETQVGALCRTCPIRPACFIYGMTQDFGMWGGASERRRRKMRVTRTQTICFSCTGRMIVLTHISFRAEICPRCGISWITV